ncbi:uncharacterized protein LOC135949185 [Calliphora vicina]|uniref:uncharacterized protein LOC135949185 n=1 Tax=Calliphora vicina TaxID=7373 RepID=UPI00325BEC97
MSVGEVALYIMRGKNPEDVMQISDTQGTTMTYDTALTTAIRIAQHFKKMQLTADDVVGIFAPNTLYVAPVAMAAWFNGTPFQATNCAFETIILCDGQYHEKVKSALESFNPLIYTLCNHLDNVPKVEDLLEPTLTEHFFFFSNGSSTLFSTSNIDWSTGLFTLIANVLVGGRRLLTTKPLTPEYLLDLIVKYKINFLSTNPEIMLQLSLLPNYNSKTMKSVRLIFMTGSFCSEATLKRIRSALFWSISMVTPNLEVLLAI